MRSPPTLATAVLVFCLACPPRAAAAPRSVEEIARAAKESVVTIRFTGRRATDEGLGTGFVVGDGLVATNLHVIGEARPITVELADGRTHDATAVHATDRDADLAIVRIDVGGLTPLPLADPRTVVDGQEVVAVGNPHGLRQSVVAGRVSAVRDVDGIAMIQVALPIEPGNSGGPLLDLEGRVHGVVSMKSLVTPNLGFAVAVDRLRGLLDRPNPVAMDRWLTIGTLDPAEWTAIGGARWRQRAGRISVAGAGTGFGGRSLCLALDEPPPQPYEVAAWVKLDDEAGAAGLAFSADGGDRHYGFYPSAGRLRLTRFDGPDVLSWKILDEKPSPRYRPGEWNHLRVRVAADAIACFVNDEAIFTSADRGLAGGRAGLVKFRDTEAEFRGFAVGKDLPRAMPAADVMARIEAVAAELPDEAAPAAREPADDLVAKLLPEGDAARVGLMRRAAELERQADVLRYLDAILVVDPDSARDRVMRMITAARLGRRSTALADARWLLDHQPPGIDLDQVQSLVARLESEP